MSTYRQPSRRRIRPRICLIRACSACGATFLAQAGNANRFCSRECFHPTRVAFIAAVAPVVATAEA